LRRLSTQWRVWRQRPGRPRLEAGLLLLPCEPGSGGVPRITSITAGLPSRSAIAIYPRHRTDMGGPESARRRRRLDPRRARVSQTPCLRCPRTRGVMPSTQGHSRRALGARPPEPPGPSRIPGCGARLAVAGDRRRDPGRVRHCTAGDDSGLVPRPPPSLRRDTRLRPLRLAWPHGQSPRG